MITGIIGSLLSGPLLGLIGSVVTKGMSLYETKLKMEDAQRAREHEYKLQELSVADRREDRENVLALAEVAAAASIRTASYDHDASYGTNAATPYIRYVRPVLTFMLLAVVLVMWFTLGDAVIVEGATIKARIVLAVIEITGMAFAWWFGDRSMDQQFKKVK